MSRRMSVSLTLDAVRERRKTVTRRHVDTWRDLKPGDRLTLIEKGMGLPKGAKQVAVAEVEIVDVRVEPILNVTQGEIYREGFDPNEWGDLSWAAWWARSHRHPVPTWERGQSFPAWQAAALGALADVECRRIEWRYIDDPVVQAPSSHPGVLASTGGQATPVEAVEPGQVSPSPVPAPAKQEEDA